MFGADTSIGDPDEVAVRYVRLRWFISRVLGRGGAQGFTINSCEAGGVMANSRYAYYLRCTANSNARNRTPGHFVLKMRSLVFDFGVYVPMIDTL
eukprot:2541710-Rhodomonas_salina.2